MVCFINHWDHATRTIVSFILHFLHVKFTDQLHARMDEGGNKGYRQVNQNLLIQRQTTRLYEGNSIYSCTSGNWSGTKQSAAHCVVGNGTSYYTTSTSTSNIHAGYECREVNLVPDTKLLADVFHFTFEPQDAFCVPCSGGLAEKFDSGRGQLAMRKRNE